MSTPRISGTLNNCALHAMVPSLLHAIEQFSLKEKNDFYSMDENLEKHHHAFEDLRHLFAAFYGLNPQEFNWSKFNALMSSMNNYYAQQVVFGPVLREFMLNNYDQMDNPHFNVIQDNGRYPNLDIGQAHRYAYAPLGITLRVNASDSNLYAPFDDVATPWHHLTLYYNDEHFELVPPAQIHETVSDRGDLYHQARLLDSTITALTSGTVSKITAEQGLNNIKSFVQDAVTALSQESIVEDKLDVDDEDDFQEFDTNFDEEFEQYSVQALSQETVIEDKFNVGFDEEDDDLQEFDANFDEELALQQFKSELTTLYRQHGFFEAHRDTEIQDHAQLDRAKAQDNESDEDFAKRLQEAEFRLYKGC